MVAAQQLCARNSARRAQPAAVRSHTCVLGCLFRDFFVDFLFLEGNYNTPVSKVDGYRSVNTKTSNSCQVRIRAVKCRHTHYSWFWAFAGHR